MSLDRLSERVRLEQGIWDNAAARAASGIRWGELSQALSAPALRYLYNFLMETGLAGKLVLELGGSGRRAVPFVLSGAERAWALDVSMATLRLGMQGARQWDCAARVLFLQAAAERLPFADDSLDIIYGGAILHHLLLDQATEEIYRVLKPGGRAAFCEPLGQSAHLRFARDRLPYRGKLTHGTDRPLRYSDLERFIGLFDWGEYREFELVEQLAKLLPVSLARAWRRATRPLDRLMLRHLPFLGRFCRTVSLCVRKGS